MFTKGRIIFAIIFIIAFIIFMVSQIKLELRAIEERQELLEIQ